MSDSPGLLRPRNLLIAALVGVGLIVLVLSTSVDAKRAAELRAGEFAGDVAARVIASNTESGGDTHSRDFISIPIEVRKLADNVYQARGVGNTQVIATSAGHVVYDTGLATQAAKQRRLLGEALPEGPITHVILSHSHQDHVGGTRFWTEDDTEIVAHFESSQFRKAKLRQLTRQRLSNARMQQKIN